MTSPSLRHPFRTANGRRAGISLIEMCVVIVLAAVLLGMLVTLMTGLLRFHHRSTQRSVARAEINRLTDQLRRDLRLARRFENPGDATLVITTASGPAILYELDGEMCRRTRDAATDGKAQRDRFAIGPARGWQVEPLFDDGQLNALAVTILRTPELPQESAPPPIQVVAADVQAPIERRPQ